MLGRALASGLAVAGLIGGWFPAVAGAAGPPRASLQDFLCQPAPNQLNRVIGVQAVMRPMPGTQRMQLMFVLQRRPAGRNWFSAVPGRDLGNWLSPPNPTLGQLPTDVWKVNKPVVNLPGPATYRFRVTFRWVGTAGVIGSQTRLSPLCTQPR
jgi:hypothetical protein